MSLLDEALHAPGCVLSVMGAHAGEQAAVIFGRKIADCGAVGRTFWLVRSAKARPEYVQALCGSGPGYAIFVAPATRGGARPTIGIQSATEYSPDRETWFALPLGIGPVTGHMDNAAAALIFDALTTDATGVVDLWAYADRLDNSRPLRFALGRSTVCAFRKDTSAHPARMKSRYRAVVAVGRLVTPHCVWVR